MIISNVTYTFVAINFKVLWCYRWVRLQYLPKCLQSTIININIFGLVTWQNHYPQILFTHMD